MVLPVGATDAQTLTVLERTLSAGSCAGISSRCASVGSADAMTSMSGSGRSAGVRSVADMPSSLAAMMKSFSCRPLIFLVCSETVA